jgi:hypothetical protein
MLPAFVAGVAAAAFVHAMHQRHLSGSCVLIDCNTSARTLTELIIAKTYVRLCATPEDNPEASVSLASIDGYEIRMLAGPAVDLDSAPLFWLELFDHSTKTSVDSFCCHRLKDAAPVVHEFFGQLDDLNKTDETS